MLIMQVPCMPAVFQVKKMSFGTAAIHIFIV